MNSSHRDQETQNRRWNASFSGAGKVQPVEPTDMAEGRLYRYEFMYRTVTLLVSVTVDDDGKVAALTAADDY